MAKAPTPPIGLQLDLAKADLRNFGSRQLATRVVRGSDGRWNTSKSGVNLGYIVFLDKTEDALAGLPDHFSIKISGTRRTAGFATVCS